MSFFSKKKVAKTTIDPLSLLFADITASCDGIVSFNGSAKGTIVVSNASLCRAALASSTEKIQLLFVHTVAAEPCAGLFFPIDSLAAIEAIGTSWISKFPPEYTPAISFAKQYSSQTLEADLWPFLEMEVYQLNWGEKTAWLCIEKNLRETLSVVIQGPSLQVAPHSPEVPQTLAISRKHDFLALDSFFPQSILLAKSRILIQKETFSITTGIHFMEKLKGTEEKSLNWYLASFEVGGTQAAPGHKTSLLYAFEEKNGSSASQNQDALTNALSASLFQQSMKNLEEITGQKPQKPSIQKLKASPDLSRTASLLTVKATIVGSPSLLPVLLVTPTNALTPLFTTFSGDPSIARQSHNTLARILAVNEKMRTLRFPDSIALPALRSAAPFLFISELLEHLSPVDYDLILQNCLITRLGAKKLPALFYYNEPIPGDDDEKRERIIPLGPLDFKRLTANMSDVFREEFIDHCSQLRGNSLSQCVAINLEEMKNIEVTLFYRRIAASPRLSYLIHDYFHAPLRAQGENKLKKLRESNYPFAAFKALSPLLAQKALNRLEDRDAALSLLDAKEEVKTFQKFMSGVRLGRLKEEIVFMRGRYDAEELGPDEILRAKKLLAQTCEDVMKSDDEPKPVR